MGAADGRCVRVCGLRVCGACWQGIQPLRTTLKAERDGRGKNGHGQPSAIALARCHSSGGARGVPIDSQYVFCENAKMARKPSGRRRGQRGQRRLCPPPSRGLASELIEEGAAQGGCLAPSMRLFH